MTLRMLPGPFLGWLGVLMFLLVMQFLIMYLKDLVGKGLPVGIIFELIAYNLAYMVALAVPMAALIAVLTAFGRLAETGSYAVLKSAGISYQQIVWPVLVVAAGLMTFMVHFNGSVLPEANFRARTLWVDIRSTRPGFALKPGVFYGGLEGYRILVRDLPPEDPSKLVDVLIFDYTDGARFRTDIKAESGAIRAVAGGRFMEIDLRDGEIHRRRPQTETGADRYERYSFERHRLLVSIEDFDFERSDPSSSRRTDRTMPSAILRRLADSLDTGVVTEQASIDTLVATLATRRSLVEIGRVVDPVPAEAAADSLSPDRTPGLTGIPDFGIRNRKIPPRVREAALEEARLARTRLENARHTIDLSRSQADRFRVELYKKHSLAIACLVFMLIGAPLGLRIRRGSLAMTAVIALGVFLFYWVGLVIGEKQADRGFISPWLGMWAPNLLGISIALWMNWSAVLDRNATASLWVRIRRKLGGPAPDPAHG